MTWHELALGGAMGLPFAVASMPRFRWLRVPPWAATAVGSLGSAWAGRLLWEACGWGCILVGALVIVGPLAHLTSAGRGKVASVVVLCAAAFAWTSLGLCVVYTPSIPVGLYRLRRLDERAAVPVGATVCVRSDDPRVPSAFSSHLAGRASSRVCKLLVAKEGDRIEEAVGGALINGVPLANSLPLTEDGAGSRVPHARLPRTLDEGEVWLASTHPRGFDSRYVGPFARESLRERAELWWAL